MMKNAGRSMAVLAIRTLGPLFEQASVLVVAGPGGNGGGGFCAARHLAAGGWDAWSSVSRRPIGSPR
jgi:NAD(P)H-hydrate epimerase